MFLPPSQCGQGQSALIEKARRQRDERQGERRRELSALRIQAWYRGQLARIRLRCQLRDEFRASLSAAAPAGGGSISAEELLSAAAKLLYRFDPIRDLADFELLARRLVSSSEATASRAAYPALLLKKARAAACAAQLSKLIAAISACLAALQPDTNAGHLRTASVCLSALLALSTPERWGFLSALSNREAYLSGLRPLLARAFSGPSGASALLASIGRFLWLGLARQKSLLSPLLLGALLTASLRAADLGGWTAGLIDDFLRHLLSVPGLVAHAAAAGEAALPGLLEADAAGRLVDRLAESDARPLCSEQSPLDAGRLLCTLANLVQLAQLDLRVLADRLPAFCLAASALLRRLRQLVSNGRAASSTSWHPVLGWFSHPCDPGLQESMPTVAKQLQLLCGAKMVRLLFADLLGYEVFTLRFHDELASGGSGSGGGSSGSSGISIKRPTFRLLKGSSSSASKTSDLPRRLWRLVQSSGSAADWSSVANAAAKTASQNNHWEDSSASPLHLLTLFCESSAALLTVLDDVELFEQERCLQLTELASLAAFLNRFVYSHVCAVGPDAANAGPAFQAALRLLAVLHTKDTRHPFCPPAVWLVPGLKPHAFLADLERERPAAQFLLRACPHVLPLRERIGLFRRLVRSDKNALGLLALETPPSTLIVVRRSQLVEDGYRQLAALPVAKLKGTVRVRFVNDLGLDEAGIDQDGVFKEFLEEILRRVLDPSLNLFKATEDQRLYPSPTSCVQENHLLLFEFVGRLLGKAVYEGIVVDVAFATFFLTQMLDRQRSSFYSFVDELASLDAMLYKNLTFIKHYEGDLSELELTFSYDEDVMGQVVTHDLVPGGRFVALTNENRYYGGFHSGHRVIQWLWEVLERDFSPAERALFLKFVTSCSRPPLLGFAHLQPPLSIRCVEVAEDQDTGDTLGTVLKGFFRIRSGRDAQRLPTSSTCFNLLKLPNYAKKATLRDKLRYAISSHSGFELS
uniref:HECT-type E3 ubiquitin transferase n=2 Tax=Macrostomum lignano TaxID=282301 RepID=A0A1I8JIS5_9PLAT